MVSAREKTTVREVPQLSASGRQRVQSRLARHTDKRFQHEVEEMHDTDNLDRIDDDVEQEATLFEWFAPEHTHRPKSIGWHIAAASFFVVVISTLLFMGNIIAAVVLGIIAGLIYHFARKQPATMRYRIMVDGVAINTFLYHYRDLAAFNIVYEPDETKTVILRSKRLFAPLIHMEIGDADPIALRDLLLEFVPEDHDLDEPWADRIARRLNF